MRKYTPALVSGLFTVALFGICTFTACTKDGGDNGYCISEVTKARHKDDVCPSACPGVVGCDGKKYCNLCAANKAGVNFVK
ncbi:MAG: hypothetical protein EOP51_10705 [Sphingobacteriales bacterium]|nr:MAG: hypothetical protein EOP51_10705 [Sphingobacteriales bacterium]